MWVGSRHSMVVLLLAAGILAQDDAGSCEVGECMDTVKTESLVVPEGTLAESFLQTQAKNSNISLEEDAEDEIVDKEDSMAEKDVGKENSVTDTELAKQDESSMAEKGNNQWGSRRRRRRRRRSRRRRRRRRTHYSGGSSGSPGGVKSALAEHNRLRAKHQAGPLTWDSGLARQAQTWVNKCKWGHSPHSIRRGAGENMAMSMGMRFSAAADTKRWYDELHNPGYRYGSGFSMGTGHFTQVVWRSTKKLGCAAKKCGQRTYFCCQYYPPGNVQGRFPANVKPR